MNKADPKCLRVTRWLLTIAAGILALSFLFSTWRCTMWSSEKTRLSLERGAVRVSVTSDEDIAVRRRLGHAPSSFRGLHLLPYGDQGSLTMLWRLMWQPSPSGNAIYIIPLWLPFLVFAAPSVILWLLSMERRKKGNTEPATAPYSEPATRSPQG